MEKPTFPERVQALEIRLGVPLVRRDLALTAITHKSYAYEHPDEKLRDNERLEFLGDAVVDLAIGHRLMERFPQAPEGELTRLRSLIVNELGLARVARELGLGELLLLGRGEEMTGGREKSSVLADALEAVLGAVYLGSGLETVMALVDQHFADVLDGVAEGRSGMDYKTKLQSEVQGRLKLPPRYRLLSETGLGHEKMFEVQVAIGADLYAKASGRNKKEAEQEAARLTLDMLRAEMVPKDDTLK